MRLLVRAQVSDLVTEQLDRLKHGQYEALVVALQRAAEFLVVVTNHLQANVDVFKAVRVCHASKSRGIDVAHT